MWYADYINTTATNEIKNYMLTLWKTVKAISNFRAGFTEMRVGR
jgi:hypothetical protein